MKHLYLGPSRSNHGKNVLEILPVIISISRPSFMTKLFTIQKMIKKRALSHSCANTHDDVTTFEVFRVVLKIKKLNARFFYKQRYFSTQPQPQCFDVFHELSFKCCLGIA